MEETISAYGDAEALGRVRERLTVVDAPEVITTEEHPVMALRRNGLLAKFQHDLGAKVYDSTAAKRAAQSTK